MSLTFECRNVISSSSSSTEHLWKKENPWRHCAHENTFQQPGNIMQSAVTASGGEACNRIL